jgi:hypothetical protein
MGLTAVALISDGWRWRVPLASAATLLAFLSHTSTFATLTGMLLVAELWVWLAAEPPAVRRRAAILLVALLLTIAASVGLYYGRFGSTYRAEYSRIRAEVAGRAGTPAPSSPALYQPGGASIPARARAVPQLAAEHFTWPFLLLAIAGTVVGARTWRRDPVWLLLCGWLVACGAFLLLGVLTPVDFRHYYAALPAVAVMAAIAVVAGWRLPGATRFVVAALTLCGAAIGVNHWLGRLGAPLW